MQVSGSITASTSLKVNGTKVIGAQGSSVATVSGTAGSSYTSNEQIMLNNLETTVNAIINRLQGSTGHGLIAG